MLLFPLPPLLTLFSIVVNGEPEAIFVAKALELERLEVVRRVRVGTLKPDDPDVLCSVPHFASRLSFALHRSSCDVADAQLLYDPSTSLADARCLILVV